MKFTTSCAAMLLTVWCSTSAWGVTEASFEGAGDTPFTLEFFNSPPGPSITGPGPSGDFLLLTDAVNDQQNWVTFDLSDPGEHNIATFSFDFLVDPTDSGPSADGFGFSFIETATYGDSGGVNAALGVAEDPRAAGVLGFGFDTWSNAGTNDADIPTGTDYQEISVFYDNELAARILGAESSLGVDDTPIHDPGFLIDDGNSNDFSGLHNVTGTVDFAKGTVDLQLDRLPIFTDLEVPGLAPFESRIMIAGRTGGENEFVLIDNVCVDFGGTGCIPSIEGQGDFNGDGTIDAADFAIMAENFNQRVSRVGSHDLGDFNYDTRIDLKDFLEFRKVFNAQGAAASVPEPGAGLLLAGGIACLLSARRWRRE